MAIHSSSSARNYSVSIFVSIKSQLTSESPIWSLSRSSFPTSKMNLFLVGEAHLLPDHSIFKRSNFKTVKIITSTHDTSIYTYASRSVAGDIVLFTGSDCRPERHWVKEMLAAFNKDQQAALVLGEVQWRRTSFKNKTEQYCEQTGFNSTSQSIGVESYCEITQEKEGLFESPTIDKITDLLKDPTNLAVRSKVLLSMRKAIKQTDQSLVIFLLKQVFAKKTKVLYQPDAVVEVLRSMSLKKLNKLMFDKAIERAAWLQSRTEKTLQFELQLFGKHELCIPFGTSVDISWGNFHWMHFWGILAFWKFSSLCFSTHFSGAFWAADELILITSIFGFSLFGYFLPILKVQPWSNFMVWCWFRYRSNMSMFLGGLWASFKFKCFYWAESW